MNAPTAPIVPHAAPSSSTSTTTVVLIVLACVAAFFFLVAVLGGAMYLTLGVRHTASVEAVRAAEFHHEAAAQAARAEAEAAERAAVRPGVPVPTPR